MSVEPKTEDQRIEEAKNLFGFDPRHAGLRHRGWWIIAEPDEDDLSVGAKAGYLCVKARDGGSNDFDGGACRLGNYIGTTEDGFDCTYRYYYYAPIAEFSI